MIKNCFCQSQFFSFKIENCVFSNVNLLYTMYQCLTFYHSTVKLQVCSLLSSIIAKPITPFNIFTFNKSAIFQCMLIANHKLNGINIQCYYQTHSCMCANVFTGFSYINTTLINSISLQQYLSTNFSLVIHVLVEPWLLPRIQGRVRYKGGHNGDDKQTV